MNPWISIIAQYGMDFAIELAGLLKGTPEPTADDFTALKVKYGTKTEQQYVDEALAALGRQTPPPTTPGPGL